MGRGLSGVAPLAVGWAAVEGLWRARARRGRREEAALAPGAARPCPYAHARPASPLLQVPSGTPVVNALAKQRAMLENIFRACVGLPPENNMMLEFKC